MAIQTLDEIAEFVYQWLERYKDTEPGAQDLRDKILLMVAHAGDGKVVTTDLIAGCMGGVVGVALGYGLPLAKEDYSKLLSRVTRKIAESVTETDLDKLDK